VAIGAAPAIDQGRAARDVGLGFSMGGQGVQRGRQGRGQGDGAVEPHRVSWKVGVRGKRDKAPDGRSVCERAQARNRVPENGVSSAEP